MSTRGGGNRRSGGRRPPPRIIIPVRLMYAVSFNDLAAWLLRRDFPMAMAGTRISDSMSPLDHGRPSANSAGSPSRRGLAGP